MLSTLYFKLGIFGVVVAIFGGAYYKFCYEPKAKLEKKYKETAKELRAEYLKNSSLEVDLSVCLKDNNVSKFEGEMKGAGDAIDDINLTIVSDKLIF